MNRPVTPVIEPSLLQRFRELIADRIGLQIPDRDFPRLKPIAGRRLSELKLQSIEKYLELLDSQSLRSSVEWKVLATHLTIGESFFFRDNDQLELMCQELLPRLIDSRQQDRTLRIWSAGCSTGEEPYSIAILLREMLPPISTWNLQILGSDIDETALERARAGQYSEWSLRQVSAEQRQRFFRRTGSDWCLDESIRSMVKFESVNLLTGSIPREFADGADLVICRNVLIYFDAETVGDVASKLVSALREGGYLVTGHGELLGSYPTGVTPRVFPQSVVFQRITQPDHVSDVRQSVPKTSFSNSVQRELPAADPSSHNVAPRIRKSAELLAIEKVEDTANTAAKLAAALESVDTHIGRAANDARAWCLRAQRQADSGQLDLAAESCQRAAEIDAGLAEPHYILAQLAQEGGRWDECISILKRALYLEPDHLAANLDLASCHERVGDHRRAAKQLDIAVELLKALPPDSATRYNGLGVKQLLEQIQAKK